MRNLFIILFFTNFCFSQTKLFVHDNAKFYVQNTKKIAILPLDTSLRLRAKELKEFTKEQIIEMQNDMSLNIQKAMHSWFLTRRQRGSLLVDEIQNPIVTNSILKEANIEPLDAYEMLPSKVCEILGVEAIITGQFNTNKPMSNAAALGMALVFGFGGATQNATLNLDFIHNDNEVVVNYYKNVKGGLGSSENDLINTLMRKVSRRIPYTE